MSPIAHPLFLSLYIYPRGSITLAQYPQLPKHVPTIYSSLVSNLCENPPGSQGTSHLKTFFKRILKTINQNPMTADG